MARQASCISALRRVAADGRQHQLGRHGVGVEPELGPDQQGGVDRGANPSGTDDPQAVGPPEQGIARRG